jgi:hypothetical protein
MNRATFLALASVFLAAGTVLARLALRELRRRREFVASSALAEGVVIGFTEERSGATHRTSFFPKIEFRLGTGQVVRFDSGAGSEAPTHAVGDSVRVRYRTNGPPDAELDDFLALWGLSLVLSSLALTFLAIGAAMLLGWIPA